MDVNITGAKVLYTIKTNIPILGDIQITETIVVGWLVLLLITAACVWLTRDLKVEDVSKRQAIAEMLYEMAHNFVDDTMGKKFKHYVPFIAALFLSSIVSNLIGLTGLRSPTSDLSTEAAWAVVVFVLITKNKIKAGGVGGYFRGFLDPIPLLAPFNVISEFATPISMACRHFGNMLSGLVINALIYAALAALSAFVFGLLPGFLGDLLSQIPILSVGIPAVTSVYFDWFSSFMQAYIFCMLTTMFIADAAGE